MEYLSERELHSIYMPKMSLSYAPIAGKDVKH
jgi:hypothetical protein